MKRLLLGMLTMMTLVMSGCGSPTETVVVTIEPPSITLLRFTPDPATEFIDGSVDFFAPEADIASMTVEVFDSRGVKISSTKFFPILPGVVRGTILFSSIDYRNRTFLVDTLTLSIFLTDIDGITSDRVEDTFRVP